MLFDGDHANIALTRPDAGFEEIVLAGQVACAHEFIEAMPAGYSSSVIERGMVWWSAAALGDCSNDHPEAQIVGFDEATSAADVDTERRLTANLMQLYKGSTVFLLLIGLLH